MLDLFSYTSLKDVPSHVAYHYKQGNFNYPMIIYISLVHMVALAGLVYMFQASRETLLWAFCLWPIRYERTNNIDCEAMPNITNSNTDSCFLLSTLSVCTAALVLPSESIACGVTVRTRPILSYVCF